MSNADSLGDLEMSMGVNGPRQSLWSVKEPKGQILPWKGCYPGVLRLPPFLKQIMELGGRQKGARGGRQLCSLLHSGSRSEKGNSRAFPFVSNYSACRKMPI